jgi:hypothetical protein
MWSYLTHYWDLHNTVEDTGWTWYNKSVSVAHDDQLLWLSVWNNNCNMCGDDICLYFETLSFVFVCVEVASQQCQLHMQQPCHLCNWNVKWDFFKVCMQQMKRGSRIGVPEVYWCLLLLFCSTPADPTNQLLATPSQAQWHRAIKDFTFFTLTRHISKSSHFAKPLPPPPTRRFLETLILTSCSELVTSLF